MNITIKHRLTNAILFEFEAKNNSVAITLRAAISSNANLRNADLRGANLSGAYLRDANLRDADLSSANLSDANLSGAILSGANLSDANLSGAYLRDANLSDANLSDANLRGANLRDAALSDADLSGAYLRGADLSGADLRDANLTPIRDDLWAVLSSAPCEVRGLIAALKAGWVDGTVYTGDCACLVGTLANLRGVSHSALDGLTPNASRPIERFFLAINRGDTPETNQFSALAVQWAEDWLARMTLAFTQVAA